MVNTKFLKAGALFSSVSLVILFLCFRSGLFDTWFSREHSLQTSPNGGAIKNSLHKDSSNIKPDTNRLLLSSSKVIILTDKKLTLPDLDKKQKPPSTYSLDMSSILSSTKSSRIFRPGTIKDIQIKLSPKTDSLLKKYDTLKVIKAPEN